MGNGSIAVVVRVTATAGSERNGAETAAGIKIEYTKNAFTREIEDAYNACSMCEADGDVEKQRDTNAERKNWIFNREGIASTDAARALGHC